MGLKAVVDSLDGISEGFHDLYKEADGKFVADIEGLDDHPTVRGVITANKTNKETRDRLKVENENLRKRVELFPEDFDPESYSSMLERLEKNEGPDVDEKLVKQRTKLEERFGVEQKTLTDKITSLEAHLERMVVDDGFSRAMDVAHVDGKHKAKLMPYLKSLGKVVIEESNGAYSASVDTDLGPVSLSQFVQDWAASEDGKDYIAKSTGPRPRGGDGTGARDTVTRAEFDGMTHTQRAKAAKDGIKVVD